MGSRSRGGNWWDLRLERNRDWTGALDAAADGGGESEIGAGIYGVSADPGLRITAAPGQTEGLTEIATAFFPAKLEGSAAFRLTDSAATAWAATLLVEGLPQTVQVDALHLFSIGEGIAYGSSLFNYVVLGAPVGTFQVELSDEYENVEFTGNPIILPLRCIGLCVCSEVFVEAMYEMLAIPSETRKIIVKTKLWENEMATSMMPNAEAQE